MVKNAMQHYTILNIFLEILPLWLYHYYMVNDATSLIAIYNIIQSYYQLAPSQSTSIKFNDTKCELNGTELKRSHHLYLCLR